MGERGPRRTPSVFICAIPGWENQTKSMKGRSKEDVFYMMRLNSMRHPREIDIHMKYTVEYLGLALRVQMNSRDRNSRESS